MLLNLIPHLDLVQAMTSLMGPDRQPRRDEPRTDRTKRTPR